MYPNGYISTIHQQQACPTFSQLEMDEFMKTASPLPPADAPTTPNNPPPPPPSNLTAPPSLKRSRRMRAFNSKKQLLAYKDRYVVFHAYKLYYLVSPIIIHFNHRVKVFRCHPPLSRIGITNISLSDMALLQSHLRNVAGSLPVTVKTVRSLVVPNTRADNTSDTLFINLNTECCGLFSDSGMLMNANNLPRVCNARIAIMLNGMKTKDDEASYMIRAHQIMLKKDEPNTQSPFHLMFSVDDDSDYEDETGGVKETAV